MYWYVASTPSGNGEVVMAKWLSLENHIHNIHIGHTGVFPKCTHADLSGPLVKRKWFKRHKYKQCTLYNNTCKHYVL